MEKENTMRNEKSRSPKQKQTKEEKSFSAKFDQLQTIVTEVEQDDADVEKSIPKFRHAMELARELLRRLKDMENEVQEIRKDFTDINLDETEEGI